MALKLSCVLGHMPTLYQGEGSVKLFGEHRIEKRQFRAEKGREDNAHEKTDMNPETLENTWFKKEEGNT